MSQKKKTTVAWAGFSEGRLDQNGFRLGIRDDLTPIIAVFRTRAAARKIFADVRRVEIREVTKK